MVSCRHAAFSGLLSVLCVAGFGYPQTPTTDTLHWLLGQKANQSSAPVVSRAEFPSRSGSVARGKVTVQASTPQAARRAAIRYVYIHSVRNVGVSLQEFAHLRDQMAEAASEIKNLKAKILSTQKTGGGYTVDVELAQSGGDLAQDLQRSALSNFRMVALLPETIDGQRDNAPKVETALIGALADKQFRVYDWNFVSSRKPLTSLVSATLGRQNEAAVQLGNRFLANVIVAGRVETKFSQDNGGIISYRASANLRVIKTDTGQILTAREYAEKGFGQNKAQAARESLEALAQKVAKELPDELESHFDEYPITVQIPLQKPEQAAEVETFLRNLTGVKSVESTPTANGASFRLVSREKPVALAARIQQSRDYRLTSNDTTP